MFLLHYLDLLGDVARIVSPDLGTVAVLKRCDDPPTVCVIFGVGAGYEHHIERQHDAITLYLNVPLLHQVEETHLNTFREVRKFVNAEYPPVCAGN